MKSENKSKLNTLANIVNTKIQGVETIALVDENRAYGGIIRAAKGKLLEELCCKLVYIAWDELGGKESDIVCNHKRIPIRINPNYIDRLKSLEVKEWIRNNIDDFVFNAQVDVHVNIKGKFVMGIECKAYTENAMLKRILVDFTLLKSAYPDLLCGLLQLESQLTGDYSQIHKSITYGSHSSHTLMSHFDVDLNIMTLLNGERKVDEPIHKQRFFKPLKYFALEKVVLCLKNMLKIYI